MSSPEEKKSLFRQKAFAKLASPDQIDRLLVVMTPKGWVALLALFWLIIAALIWSFVGEIPLTMQGKGILMTEKGVFNVVSPYSGIVTEVCAKNDESFSKDNILVKIGKNEVKPLVDGKILEIFVREGDWVNEGEAVVWAQMPMEKGEEFVCYAYFPVSDGEKIGTEMEAKIALENIDIGRYGYLLGKVKDVSNYPVTERSMLNRFRNPGIVALLKQGQAGVIQTEIGLDKDPNTPSGYRFSSKQSPPPDHIMAGTICDVRIVADTKAPISYLFPSFTKRPVKHEKK